MDPQIATAGRTPALRALRALTWLVVNVVAAFPLVYPLGLAELAVRHLLGSALDAPWAPFVSEPGDLQAAVLGAVLLGGPVLLVVVVTNRAIRWTHSLPFWVATTAVLIAPAVVSDLLNLTLAETFGKGLLW